MKEYCFVYKNVWIRGMVLVHKKWQLKTVMTYPYFGWEKELYMGGPSRANPKHFLTERGQEVIEQMLIENYIMAKRLYRAIDPYCTMYKYLLQEKEALISIYDAELQERIASKLEDWFFQSMFCSRITGLIPSNTERPQIINILEKHLKDKA